MRRRCFPAPLPHLLLQPIKINGDKQGKQIRDRNRPLIMVERLLRASLGHVGKSWKRRIVLYFCNRFADTPSWTAAYIGSDVLSGNKPCQVPNDTINREILFPGDDQQIIVLVMKEATSFPSPEHLRDGYRNITFIVRLSCLRVKSGPPGGTLSTFKDLSSGKKKVR